MRSCGVAVSCGANPHGGKNIFLYLLCFETAQLTATPQLLRTGRSINLPELRAIATYAIKVFGGTN